MGLLKKVKNLDMNVESPNKCIPRYELFKSRFAHFLGKMGAEYGAFLIKHAAVFHLAFPIGINADTFKNVFFDASVLLDVITSSKMFLSFPNEMNKDVCLLQGATLYPMDESSCVFLLLKLDESSEVAISEEKKKELLCEIQTFKNEYRENESLIQTCTPLYKRYVGFSFLESKFDGSAQDSMTVNFIKFSFDNAFDLLRLEHDIDLLPLFYSLINRIGILIGKSNFSILQKDLSLNACIFSRQPLDETVYSRVLRNVLSSIYGESLIEKITISFFL